MGVVAMKRVITFDPEKQSDEHRKFEEGICEEMMPFARRLAKKRARWNKWSLNQDELYLEFCAAIAKTIAHYAHGVTRKELIVLCHAAMKHKYQDVLHKTTRTYRNVEDAAHVLDADMGFGEDIEMGYVSSDFLNDFVSGLSPLARRLVELSIEPDEKMSEQIGKYIDYRNTRYKNGAGVSKIPLRLFAEATNRPIKEIKQASKEIHNKLTEVNMTAASMDTETLLNTFRYGEKIVTSYQSTKKYVAWKNDDLYEQAEYRGIKTDGYRRGEVAKRLHEFDMEHGLPTQFQLDEEHEIDEDLTIEDLIPPPEIPEVTKVSKKSKVETTEGDDDFDDDFWEKKKGKGKPDKPETSEELSKFFEDDPDDDGDDDQAEKEVEEEPVLVPAVKAETTSSHASYESKNDVIRDAINEMNLGSTMITTRIGENEWHSKVIQPQRTGMIPVDVLMQLIETYGATIPAKAIASLADPPKVVAEEIATRKKASKGSKAKASHAQKKGSPALRKLICQPEYLKLRESLKGMDIEDLKEMATGLGETWTTSSDSRVLRMSVVAAIYRGNGLNGKNKYKPEYRTSEARNAVTL